ncbi:MFS transporter [Patulibacter minatonensis]|uniref:MFS transporter n=1 Tax=Patulibacter minatonensis TaxID=298163 RepID=UPI0004B4D3B0|nr:MFS transporter [Patulibacter minatonensis]
MAAARPSALASLSRLPIAVGAALALADASVVTLALPELFDRFDTTILGLAGVIGVYTVVLAAAVLAAVPARRWLGSAAVGALGMLLFAVASVMCGVSDGLVGLLVSRALQAVGAAFGLLAAYEVLSRGRTRTSADGSLRPAGLWVAAAIFGTAIGPALGGALTEAFDWRAIFLAQAPFGVLAAAAFLVPRPAADPDPTATGDTGHVSAPGSRTAPPASAAASAPGSSDAPPAGSWPLPAPRPPRSTARPSGHDDPTRVHGADPDPTLIDPARGAAPLPPDGAPLREAPPVPEARPGLGRPTLDGARAGVALALVSAALTAVVFLLVLLLVIGWDVRPLKAAVGVTLLPIAALAGSRIPGDPWIRSSLGCALIGAGILALAAVPTVGAGWVVLPQVLSGLGMGMALPALAGELLPERTPGQAAQLLALRHIGITVALVLLALIITPKLDRTIEHVQEQVTSIVLDAKLPPEPKVKDLGSALDKVDINDPRSSLQEILAAQAPKFDKNAQDRATYAKLAEPSDEALVVGITQTFHGAFLLTGVLALLAALLVVPLAIRRLTVVAVLGAAGLALAAGQIKVSKDEEPTTIAIQDPCKAKRQLPNYGGLDGFVQDSALGALDSAACKFGSSREELVLALGDEPRSRAYRKAHGVDPQTEIGKLVSGALGGGGGDGAITKILKSILPGS